VTEALTIETTAIPGLMVVHMPVHADNRGWFKENWQREKMVALGLPDFGPVQNNVSFNARAGATRGIHAEPWEKLVSVSTGRIFGVWVDLREGDTFGALFTLEVGPETTVFVPRGVGNAYQTLEDSTTYSYLVNDHWSPQARKGYTFVNLADQTLKIDWPLALDGADISEADLAHPPLTEVVPFRRPRTLVLGAGGQLANEFKAVMPDAEYRTVEDFDLTDSDAFDKTSWRDFDLIINAAAYTSVDVAETTDGRRLAWAVNGSAVAELAKVARAHGIVLVHYSSDYVFDGVRDVHDEDEVLSPLGVYAQSKAAGDLAVSTVPRHYLLRTSWLVGDGSNFVRTMAGLADRGVSPSVVDDQVGRLTFTDDLVSATLHLLSSEAPFGTYNVSCEGPVQSWAGIAKDVFVLRGRSADDVTCVTTEEYGADKDMAPRPRNSTLDLGKLRGTGFVPREAHDALMDYLRTSVD
jgi:dTDP-4-dehydrorhamnose reductase/dTDP-4-dehydrorhamnose 3,5-epimerase